MIRLTRDVVFTRKLNVTFSPFWCPDNKAAVAQWLSGYTFEQTTSCVAVSNKLYIAPVQLAARVGIWLLQAVAVMGIWIFTDTYSESEYHTIRFSFKSRSNV